MGKLDAYKAIVQTNVQASSLTWLRLGGPIEYVAQPRTEEELLGLLKACEEDGIDVRPLGDGSALLVSDVGAPGLALRFTSEAFTQIKFASPYVEAGAGVSLGKLVTATVSEGLAGLEELVGLPGTVGAAVVSNVSSVSSSIGPWVESVRVASYSGEIFELSRDELVFETRSSNLENAIVLAVRFKLEKEDAETLAKRLQKLWIVRKKSRPELNSEGLGRMFKDPRGQRASELFADAGLAGARIGGATICETAPNLVVTSSTCSSEDVKRLLSLVESQAGDKFGVKLERELQIW